MERSREDLLNLLKARGCPCGRAADEASPAERLKKVAERAGGVNRLAALLRFHTSHQNRRRRRLDPSDN